MKKKRKETIFEKVFLVKRNFRFRVKGEFRNINVRLTALFVGIILGLGVFRIGWFAIAKSEQYRGSAENTSYQEVVVKAKRGSIYASDMSILASSYPVWTFIVDPVALNTGISYDIAPGKYNAANGGDKNIDDKRRSELAAEITEKYLRALSNFFAFVLNEDLKPSNKDYISADDIYKKLTTTTRTVTEKDDNGNSVTKEVEVRYSIIRKNVTAEQKMRIDSVINDCFYNYYCDQFYDRSHQEESDETQEEKEEPSIFQKILNKLIPSTNKEPKKYYFYNYKDNEYICNETYNSDQLGCIINEKRSFVYEQDTVRSYGGKGIGSSFMGFINGDGVAQYGIEQYYDEVLSGRDGKISGLAVNGVGTMVQASNSVTNEVRDGNNLVLTVNTNVQQVLEDNLKSTFEKHSADETFGIVMNVNTGAVVAMGHYPDYDLNDPYKITVKKKALKKAETQVNLDYEARKVKDEDGNIKTATEDDIVTTARNNQWSCFCVNYPYELGSTFKLFTASAGLEEGMIGTDNYYYYCNGSIDVADKNISCSHGTSHGGLDMSTALAKSCNAFFIRLGLNLGKTAFNKYFKSFGFSEKTGIDITGETVGSNRSKNDMTSVELASTSFGQTATITPIQLITAASAIANGGKLLTPHIVDRIIDRDGNIVEQIPVTERRRVVSEETCDKVKEMMKGVVYKSYGTAYNYINVDGYTICGKTGSGEIQGQGSSTGNNGFKYTASFVGFAPAEKPELAILIGIRNPEGGYLSGGQIAAPVAGNVLSFALSELDIESPSGKKDNNTIPNLNDYPLFTAKTKISDLGYKCKVYGSGSNVVSQKPAAGQVMPESGILALFTDKENHDVEVPNFDGLTKAEAMNAAREAGLNISCQNVKKDSDIVVKQSFKAGDMMEPGSIITVTFNAQ